MYPKLLALAFFGFALCAGDTPNSKRSINNLSYPSWNSVLGHPWASSSFPWNTNIVPHGSINPYSPVHSAKTTHLAADITAAVAAAKEAAAAAALAQQRVQAAREQVAIQEKVAAAKEAAAHAALQRSEAAAQVAAAIQRSEALAVAAAAAHKSAAASAASAAAAHVAGHYSSDPWVNPKPVYNHWG